MAFPPSAMRGRRIGKPCSNDAKIVETKESAALAGVRRTTLSATRQHKSRHKGKKIIIVERASGCPAIRAPFPLPKMLRPESDGPNPLAFAGTKPGTPSSANRRFTAHRPEGCNHCRKPFLRLLQGMPAFIPSLADRWSRIFSKIRREHRCFDRSLIE
jgi:hypothetical protein